MQKISFQLKLVLFLMGVYKALTLQESWWNIYENSTITNISNYSQSIPFLSSDRNQCARHFGRFCIQCNDYSCLKCQSPSFTLNSSSLPNISSSNSANAYFDACSCQSPFIYNLNTENSTLSTQNQQIRLQNPCILCTDKYSLDQCAPAAYVVAQSVLFSNSSNINTSDYSTARLTISFNRPQGYFYSYVSFQKIKRSYSVHFQIDGSPIPEQNITFSQNTNNFNINIDIDKLNQIMYDHYTKNNYKIKSSYRVQLRKKIKGQMFINGDGLPIPQSYRTEVGFKAQSQGSYQFDNTYIRYLNGTQALRFIFPTPLVYRMPPTPTNTSNSSNSTNNNTFTNISINSTTNQNNTNSSRPNTNNSSPDFLDTHLTNNYQIFYAFTDFQIKIKQSIQIFLVSLTALGLIGTGASNWMVFILSWTQIFKKMGFYTYQSQTSSLNTTSARLLFWQQVPKMQIKTQYIPTFNILKQISRNTLIFNPLILSQAQTQPISKTLPSFSLSLVYTNLVILVSIIVIIAVLLYLNQYAKSKTNFDHSHIYSILAERDMVKRAVYMTFKGIYPIIFYNFILFLKQIIEYTNKDENAPRATLIQLIKFKSNPNDTINWHLVYLVQCCIYALLTVSVPIFGILYFKRHDKNNIYIYSRMYGEEEPQQKKQQDNNQSQSSSSSSSADSSPQIQNLQRNNTNINQSVEVNRNKKIINQNETNNQDQNKNQSSFLNQTRKFLHQKFVKQFRQSFKPLFYFIFQFIYTWSFISISIFDREYHRINIIQVTLTSLLFLLTFYFSFTVSVSKSYSLLKLVDIFLILSLLILRFFWDKFTLCASVSYYLFYSSAIWAAVSILYSSLSMIYWEKKGLGVHAYFCTKVVPITNNVNLQEIALKTKSKVQHLQIKSRSANENLKKETKGFGQSNLVKQISKKNIQSQISKKQKQNINKTSNKIVQTKKNLLTKKK